MKRLLQIYGAIFSALLFLATVLGFADIPEQWVIWSRWLSQVYQFISRDTVRDPFLALAVMGVLTVPLVLACGALMNRLSNQNPATTRKGPDFDAWAQVDELELWQAACLWAEKEPALPIYRGPEYAHFRMLKEAVSKKELLPVVNLEQALALQGARLDPDAHTKATRDALQKFAESRGQRPRFLFPDIRQKK